MSGKGKGKGGVLREKENRHSEGSQTNSLKKNNKQNQLPNTKQSPPTNKSQKTSPKPTAPFSRSCAWSAGEGGGARLGPPVTLAQGSPGKKNAAGLGKSLDVLWFLVESWQKWGHHSTLSAGPLELRERGFANERSFPGPFCEVPRGWEV